MFGQHILGKLTFPFDFTDQYVPSIFNWNELGGLLNPPSWNPIMYFGYPFYEDVQFGWSFLDQFLSWIFIYDWQIGIISQMIVLFISLNLSGKFFELLGAKNYQSIFLSLAYCFSATTFSNASHMDTWRGFILFPTLLYLLSTKFLLQYKYSSITTIVFLWQYNAIAYPGAQIFAMYGAVAFVIFQSLLLRRKEVINYLSKVLIVILIALTLTLPKMFYSILFLNDISPNEPNTVNIFSSLAINIFSIYDVKNFDLDVTMRSLMVALPLTVVLIFRQQVNYLYGFSTILFIIFLISGAKGGIVIIDSIPGFNLSRYRAMDARMLLVTSFTLYTLNFLNSRNKDQKNNQHKSKFEFVESSFQIFRIGLLSAIVLTYLTREYIPINEKILILFLLILTTVAVALYLRQPKLYYSIIILAIGVFHVYHVSNQAARTWKVEASVIIDKYIGSEIKENYINKPIDYLYRPERINLTKFRDEPGRFNPKWTRFIYKRDFLTFGYVNNKGTKFPDNLEEFYNSDPMVFQFLQESSKMIDLNNNFTKSYLASDYNSVQNGIEKFKIMNFKSNSEVWKINLEASTFVVQNERNDGYWRARLEDNTSNQVQYIDSQVYRQVLRSWKLPPGDYTMYMYHDPPLFKQFIILQKLILALLFLSIFKRKF